MDNVIILGAGASADAGIPLLGNFVEKMIDIAQRKSLFGSPISQEDEKIFGRVIEIKSNLDAYLARTNFNNENLEDILSILTFNVMSGDKEAESSFNDISRAIARTIELCCSVKELKPQEDGVSIRSYETFWKGLINIYKRTGKFPTIITLNYDLVLERSLEITLSRLALHEIPFRKLRINYENTSFDFTVSQHNIISFTSNSSIKSLLNSTKHPINETDIAVINILKLHGSLNFSKDEANSAFSASNNPEILPPIFNKLGRSSSEPQWKLAIEHLRSAKHICICGYSLPKTDIYMQYFLKSVIGPNTNIRKIEIFDPAYLADSEFKERYLTCFSENMGKKLKFNESKFDRFCDLILKQPEYLFFI